MNYVELKKIINKLSGNIIIIGEFNEELEKLVSENKNILTCDHLTNSKGLGIGKKGKSKNINIKKIKRKYKNKKIDYILCNIEDVFKYQKTFIKDSIYIAKKEVYLFGKKDDVDVIQKKYNRYTNNTELTRLKEGIVLIVKTDFNPPKLKNIYYHIYDTMIAIADLISDILIS